MPSRGALIFVPRPAVEKDRLHEVVVRLDHQLMNAQPSDARCSFVWDDLLDSLQVTGGVVGCFIGS